ncbi:MAG: hybrid sensor histidine kinase/response regulator [Bacteroidales bacterium]|nr:hybrid sensor histidine kinase/response regulator [Bacteroidales bacterium]
MRTKRQYESRVKHNAIIIYILASLLCIGMIYYIANLKNSINLQKVNIEKNEKILNLTNNLIQNINKAQSYSNLYIFSGNNIHLENFNISVSKINNINDSIYILCNDNLNNLTLNQITELLNKKKKIIKEINHQYKYFNPYQELYTIIENYQPKHQKTSVSKTIQDTIIYKTEKKSFIKRLGAVFSPDKSLDSIVLVSTTTIDTINKTNEDAQNLLNNIQLYTENGKRKYIKQIEIIESKFNNLLLSDQEITKEISDLLIILHKQTLDSVINEIEKSEFLINKNINLSILIAIIALLIILTFIFLIFHDIKKVTAARKATEEAKKLTEEIMESRHKLLLSVSHDVKAPLSSILGYLELMQIDSDKNEDKQKISSMKNSAEHILSLLTNLLNFSRLDQGKETAILSKFNIETLCDDLNDMFMPLAESKHLSFVYEKNFNTKKSINSDALKIKQILSNLLSNAIKYTIDGNIIFKASNNNNEVIFNIIDEGIGIPQDKLEEIFKPFSRIDNNESLIEGNGFGLFVVKGLIDLLNGKIEVKSELGKGSHFIVKIPVEYVSANEEKIETIDIQRLKSNYNKNILVIDDDNTLLAVINSMLKKLEINCDICHSSVEFEESCKNINKYDMILTDREMGAFSGLDVLKKIKEINKEKKVILMTARSEYNKEIAIQKGFDNYIRKPFSIKNLADLFNSEIVIKEVKNKESKFIADFPELCSMFDNDEDSIINIIKTFIETTSDNLLIFNKTINNNNFNEAVNLCHKMCPMFVQLNQKESAEFLYKMDKLRGKDENSFPEWKECSIKFMNDVDNFISYLYEKYEIE